MTNKRFWEMFVALTLAVLAYCSPLVRGVDGVLEAESTEVISAGKEVAARTGFLLTDMNLTALNVDCRIGNQYVEAFSIGEVSPPQMRSKPL